MIDYGLVSVIMPSYNTGEYIATSIRSVLSQTYTNWELIIVDDCSSDETNEIVNTFLTDSRIRYCKNDCNVGAALSRNLALREARGKWIAFLDSDDTWEKYKLEEQLRFMVSNGYRFTYTDYKICLNGEWLPYVYTGPNVVTERMLFNYCFFSTITVMYDRESVGLIQIADLKKNNDYAMWFEVIKHSPCYRFPYHLSNYIKHDESLSAGSKFKLIKHFYLLYRVGLHKNIISSCIFTLNNLTWGVYKRLRYREKDG